MVFTGEQHFIISVLASSIEQGPVQASDVLDVQTPSQSLVSSQDFRLIALIIQPEFWGPFLFPSPL